MLFSVKRCTTQLIERMEAATYDYEYNGEQEFNPIPNHQQYVGPSFNRRHSSSSGKLFVGGISWETSEESFFKYFNNYGEVIDSVIMMNKQSGRPRGFGFVTFADSAVADEVLSQEHTIDGRVVEVKRTVPREDMEVTGVFRTKKIFVGGLPQFFTDDELKDYFSTYGNIVEYQIMLDHQTGRSRGFGFVTFDNEDSVEKVFSAGKIHELGGKQVEIKKAEPKRSGNSYGGMDGFGAYSSRGRNHGKWGEPHTNFGMNRQYGHFEGSYGGISAASYGGYCGYGYGFGYGRMYGFGGYRFNPYGNSGCGYGGMSMYGRAGGFNRTGSNDNDSPAVARYHPYWK